VQQLIGRVPEVEQIADEAFLANPGARPVQVVGVTRALFPREGEPSAGKDAARRFLGFVEDALAAGEGEVEYDITPVEGWLLLNPQLWATWRKAGVRVSPVEHHVGWPVDVLESLREPIAALPPGSADIFIGWEPPHGQASLELGHALLARARRAAGRPDLRPLSGSDR